MRFPMCTSLATKPGVVALCIMLLPQVTRENPEAEEFLLWQQLAGHAVPAEDGAPAGAGSRPHVRRRQDAALRG